MKDWTLSTTLNLIFVMIYADYDLHSRKYGRRAHKSLYFKCNNQTNNIIN